MATERRERRDAYFVLGVVGVDALDHFQQVVVVNDGHSGLAIGLDSVGQERGIRARK